MADQGVTRHQFRYSAASINKARSVRKILPLLNATPAIAGNIARTSGAEYHNVGSSRSWSLFPALGSRRLSVPRDGLEEEVVRAELERRW